MTDRRILPGVNLLSRREREVIALVAQGLNNQEIGERICVSPFTVKNHLRSIFAKLHVYGRVKLVLYVVNSGLVVETMAGECSHQP